MVQMVLIGESGTGKTTLWHALKDYTNGKDYFHRTVQPQDTLSKVTSSQTKTIYQNIVHGTDQFMLKVIDTPGILDTEGIEQDKKHIDEIVSFLIENGEFNAICILMKASENRANVPLLYCIKELQSLLPKDCQQNIIICQTHSQSCDQDDISNEFSQMIKEHFGIERAKIICLNNFAYQNKVQFNIMNEKKDQKYQKAYQENWKELQKLIDQAEKLPLYKSEGIKILYEKRKQLKRLVAERSLSLDDSLSTEQKLSDFRNKISSLNQKVIKITKKIITQSDVLSTHCIFCNKDCHYKCQLNYGDDLEKCWAIQKKGKCHKCQCSVKYHSHVGFTEIDGQNVIVTFDQEKVKQFGKTLKDLDEIINTEEKLEQHIQQEKEKQTEILSTIKRVYVEINKIAMIGHNDKFRVYLQQSINALPKNSKLSDYQRSSKKKVYEQFLMQEIALESLTV